MFIRNVIKEIHVHMRKENKEQKIIWLSKILGIKKNLTATINDTME